MEKWKEMSQDDRKNWIETFIGGTCGVIAIIAAVVEFLLEDNGAVAGMLKDVFGTLVVVVLLFAFMPKRKPKSLLAILGRSVEEWGEKNRPFIFKAEGYPDTNPKYSQGFRLLQNPKKDYLKLVKQNMIKETQEWSKYAKHSSGNHYTGKFLDMPDYAGMLEDKFVMELCMEQSHFKNMPEIGEIVDGLCDTINVNCGDIVAADRVGASQTIRLTCKKIASVQDVRDFINALDYIISMVKVIA